MSVPLYCTLENCPIEWAYVHYRASLPGNGLYVSLFGLLIPPSIYLSIKHRTYVFGICLVTGLLSEVIGYVGRLLLHNDPFSKTYFLTYLVCLTLGPTFMAAAIYLCLARIVVVWGEEISRIRPRNYAVIFIGCDICSLVVQAAGGAMASIAYYQDQIDLGTHIMVAGLAIQVASLTIFMALSAEFALRVRRYKESLNTEYIDLRNSNRFAIFHYGLALATLCIFTRSVFRIAELSGGFAGYLAQNEVSFMVLDGAMIVVASVTLTILHPGIGFGGRWAEASFAYRIRKQDRVAAITTMQGSESNSGEVMEDMTGKTSYRQATNII